MWKMANFEPTAPSIPGPLTAVMEWAKKAKSD
jgi:hypothetical protein